jgi:hypothetical protein
MNYLYRTKKTAGADDRLYVPLDAKKKRVSKNVHVYNRFEYISHVAIAAAYQFFACESNEEDELDERALFVQLRGLRMRLFHCLGMWTSKATFAAAAIQLNGCCRTSANYSAISQVLSIFAAQAKEIRH